MQPELTLHCFPGDTSSLAIILLSEYLGLDLKLRYLKPVNVTEKFYKASLTKKFPMLEVKNKEESYLIERFSCIIRFLTDMASNSDISDKRQFSYAIGNQNIDFICQDVMPALLALKALRMGIIEEDNQLENQLIADLTQKLTELDTLIASQAKIELNHSDFLLFVVIRSAFDIPSLQTKLRSLSACHSRYSTLSKSEKFTAIYAPYAPRLS